ncbi:MAG: hypothetical protein ACUVV0_15210 [Anaerolineae bacterium]
MKGYVDQNGQCWVEITVAGQWQEIAIKAILDTGFNGWVCLPTPIAVQLGLTLFGVQTLELADGTNKKQLTFIGEVIFGDRQEWTEIILTESQEALVGTSMLLDRVLTIDFSEKTLEITPKV